MYPPPQKSSVFLFLFLFISPSLMPSSFPFSLLTLYLFSRSLDLLTARIFSRLAVSQWLLLGRRGHCSPLATLCDWLSLSGSTLGPHLTAPRQTVTAVSSCIYNFTTLTHPGGQPMWATSAYLYRCNLSRDIPIWQLRQRSRCNIYIYIYIYIYISNPKP